MACVDDNIHTIYEQSKILTFPQENKVKLAERITSPLFMSFKRNTASVYTLKKSPFVHGYRKFVYDT